MKKGQQRQISIFKHYKSRTYNLYEMVLEKALLFHSFLSKARKCFDFKLSMISKIEKAIYLN